MQDVNKIMAEASNNFENRTVEATEISGQITANNNNNEPAEPVNITQSMQYNDTTTTTDSETGQR